MQHFLRLLYFLAPPFKEKKNNEKRYIYFCYKYFTTQVNNMNVNTVHDTYYMAIDNQ